MLKKKILVVDDEEKVAKMAKLTLEDLGTYKVRVETTGEAALEAVNSFKPDLILLDMMIPGMNGLEICKRLKGKEKTASIPIIILSGNEEESYKVSSLDSGADDYIVKPVSLNELDARIRAVLRRSETEGGEKKMIVAGIIEIDLMRHVVAVKGEKVELTAAEFMILQLLASRKTRVFTRSEILDYLWGEGKIVVEQTIDVHINHLRNKLGKAAKFIQNIRGVGYKIDEEDE